MQGGGETSERDDVFLAGGRRCTVYGVRAYNKGRARNSWAMTETARVLSLLSLLRLNANGEGGRPSARPNNVKQTRLLCAASTGRTQIR